MIQQYICSILSSDGTSESELSRSGTVDTFLNHTDLYLQRFLDWLYFLCDLRVVPESLLLRKCETLCKAEPVKMALSELL